MRFTEETQETRAIHRDHRGWCSSASLFGKPSRNALNYLTFFAFATCFFLSFVGGFKDRFRTSDLALKGTSAPVGL